MLYRVYVSAYDVLSEVQVVAHLYDDERAGEDAHGLALALSTKVGGTGESDPREWLRDALVALLEVV